MSIEILFENRKLIGKNLINIIKDKGHAKSSFSKVTNISRPTLDKLIKGEIDSLTTFKTHIEKILESHKMDYEQLMNYNMKYNENKECVFAMSDNSPESHKINSKAKEMFGILEDIVHMYELYYN